MIIQKRQVVIFMFALLFVAVSQCFPWICEGHACATKHGIELAGGKLPKFFRDGAPVVAHCSGDPDIFTIHLGSNQLKNNESFEHYIDLELLNGVSLPNMRKDFEQLCVNNKTTYDKVGTVPYAIIEWTQRLTLVFAEYRKWPQNEVIRVKCLIYAGNLAHYAQDMCMPLHTTVHYDGKVTDFNLPSPPTGIHLKVDSLLQKVDNFAIRDVNERKDIMPFTDLWAGIMSQLEHSHSLIPQVYKLQALWPGRDEPIKQGTDVAKLTKQMYEETSQFTARLFVTAWVDSEKVKIPFWDHREQTAGIFEKTDTKK